MQIPSTVTISGLGNTPDLQLQAGQILPAQVLSVQEDQALLNLAGFQLSARLETPLTPGSTITVQVQEFSTTKIILTLLASSTDPAPDTVGQLLPRLNQLLQNLVPNSPPTATQVKTLLLMVAQKAPLSADNFSVFQTLVASRPLLARLFKHGFTPGDPAATLAQRLKQLLQTPISKLLEPGTPLEPPTALGLATKLSAEPLFFIPIIVDDQPFAAWAKIQRGTKPTPQKQVGPLHITLTLETANLGEVAIQLTLFEKMVDCTVFTSPGLTPLVQAQLPNLQQTLSVLGFQPRQFSATAAPPDQGTDASLESLFQAIRPIDLKL